MSNVRFKSIYKLNDCYIQGNTEKERKKYLQNKQNKIRMKEEKRTNKENKERKEIKNDKMYDTHWLIEKQCVINRKIM